MGASATAKLDLNISSFDTAIKSAKNMLIGLAGAFATIKTVNFFKDGIADAITFGKEMQSASRAMGGFDPGALLLAQKGLEKAGMGAQEAQGHIADFVSEGRDIKELFGGADNYAKALKSAAQDYGSQASVLTRSAEKLQSVWNTLEAVGSKVRTFFMTMTEQFVGPLQAALDYLNELDLAGVGADFGKAIGDASTMLLGVFKNGDIMEVLKVGMTVAFQEGVNYLVGGLNYAAGMAAPLLGQAFAKAVEIMGKAWDLIFSGDTMGNILNGFLSIAAKFTAALLDGVNNMVRVMGAGVAMAIQGAVNNIPGLNKLLGGGNPDMTFDDAYNNTEGPISQDFIDSIRSAGKEMGDGVSGRMKSLVDGISANGSGEFKKADVFNTDESKKQLADLLGKGLETGQKAVDASREKHKGDEGISKKVLTQFSGSSSKVISDNLAKVGGGGNYLRAGMSLQERTQMEQLRAQKQGNKALEIIQQNTASKPPQPTLAR